MISIDTKVINEKETRMNSKKLNTYVTPQARDLSGLGVSGVAKCIGGASVMGPYGMCLSGSGLTSGECFGGGAPEGGTCAPTGASPEYGYCTLGDVAVEGCRPTGSIHH